MNSTFEFAMAAFRKYFKYKTKMDWAQKDADPDPALNPDGEGSADRFVYVKPSPTKSDSHHAGPFSNDYKPNCTIIPCTNSAQEDIEA